MRGVNETPMNETEILLAEAEKHAKKAEFWSKVFDFAVVVMLSSSGATIVAMLVYMLSAQK